MSKIAVLFAIVCLFVAVQAQTREPTPREICQTVNQRCLSRVPDHGNRSEVTDILNARCCNEQLCRGLLRTDIYRKKSEVHAIAGLDLVG